MRYLGIDYGKKRVGLALSDETGTMAFPLLVVENTATLVTTLAEVCRDRHVEAIVIGHSKNNAGKDNPIQTEINDLITELTLHVGVPVHLEPEYFSTQAAKRGTDNAALVDAAAAALILDSYLTRSSTTTTL